MEWSLEEKTALIEQWTPLIYKIAMRVMCNMGYNINAIDLDDLLQVGRLGILKAREGFDQNRGVGFMTYAYSVLYRMMQRECIKMSHLKYGQYFKALRGEVNEHIGVNFQAPLSLDNPLLDSAVVTMIDTMESPQGVEFMMRGIRYRDLFGIIVPMIKRMKKQFHIRKESVPRKHRGILLRRLLHGETMEVLSTRYGVSKQRVNQIYLKLTYLLKIQMCEEGYFTKGELSWPDIKSVMGMMMADGTKENLIRRGYVRHAIAKETI